jgi:flagellin-like protein
MKKLKLDMKKRGISPVIATIFLIAIVVILAVVIFFWFRSLMQERITKFDEENIELACDKVDFTASYSDGSLFISNSGNVAIRFMKIRKIAENGDYDPEINLQDWPNNGLNPGGRYQQTISLDSYKEALLIPTLLGRNEDGEKVIYNCDNKYGKKLTI